MNEMIFGSWFWRLTTWNVDMDTDGKTEQNNKHSVGLKYP